MKNKACKPFLKPCHLPGMFHLCHYLCKLLFLSQNPRFTLLASSQWLTTLFKCNLSLHCALFFCTLMHHSYFLSFHYCYADTLKAWTINFIFVTGTEHMSDKCLSSEWRLLDDLQVYNGPLKNMSFFLVEKSGRNIPSMGSWLHLRKTTFVYVASHMSPDKTHLWKFNFDP